MEISKYGGRQEPALTAYMCEFVKTLRLADRNAEAAQAENIMEGLKNHKSEVFFLGRFGSGKSTMINALIRQKTLYTNIVPSTAVITKITAGDSVDEVVITFKDSKRPDEKLSVHDFFENYRAECGSEHKYEEVDYVTVYNKMPDENITYVDSPDLISMEIQDRSAKADVIVFVMNVMHMPNKDEHLYIHKNFERRCPNNVYFVVNWWNMVREEDEAVCKKIYFDELHDVFTDTDGRFDEELYRSRVFFVDAYTAECARTGIYKKGRRGDKFIETAVSPEDDAYTGIPDFEEALGEYLQSSELKKRKYQKYVQEMTEIFRSAVKNIEKEIFGLKSCLKKENSEFEGSTQRQQAEIKRLRECDSVFRYAFQEVCNEYRAVIRAGYDNFVSGVSQGWRKHFEGMEANFIGNAGEVDSAKLLEAVNSYIGEQEKNITFTVSENRNAFMKHFSSFATEYAEVLNELELSGQPWKDLVEEAIAPLTAAECITEVIPDFTKENLDEADSYTMGMTYFTKKNQDIGALVLEYARNEAVKMLGYVRLGFLKLLENKFTAKMNDSCESFTKALKRQVILKEEQAADIQKMEQERETEVMKELAKLDNIKRKLTDSFNDFSRAAMGESYTEGEILEPAEG